MEVHQLVEDHLVVLQKVVQMEVVHLEVHLRDVQLVEVLMDVLLVVVLMVCLLVEHFCHMVFHHFLKLVFDLVHDVLVVKVQLVVLLKLGLQMVVHQMQGLLMVGQLEEDHLVEHQKVFQLELDVLVVDLVNQMVEPRLEGHRLGVLQRVFQLVEGHLVVHQMQELRMVDQ